MNDGTATPGAVKRGRDPRWPYVPVWTWTPADGSRGYTSQVVGRAFATRAEAVEHARQHLAINGMIDDDTEGA